MKKIFIIPILFIALVHFSAQAFLISDIRIISISPVEKFAVVRIGGQETRIIRQGEKLTEQLSVLDIFEDKIICQNSSDNQMETVLIRFENGKQEVQRIRKQPGEAPVFYQPYATQGSQTKFGGQ